MAADALVVFTPSGRRGRFAVGTPVLQAARALGVDIDSVCGGRGLCGRCQVVLSEGEFSKHGLSSRAENLSALSDTERAWEREQGPLQHGRRLSCSTLVLGDVVIDVPSESQVHRQIVRKRAEVLDIELDPIVRLYYVEVQEPDMHFPSSDLRRLKEALDFDWRLSGLHSDIRVVQEVQAALRHGDWKVTVAVYDNERIIAVWPGFKEKVFGMAVDIGSTTIAAHLCDLQTGEVVASAGRMNPQIRFGEDLMSRVSYVMMNPGGDRAMTHEVRGALNDLAFELATEAGIGVNDIVEATFVGNPIMHHLLFGVNPVELGGAPFALATDESVSGLWATEIDLYVHPNARVYALPCIAGHVGADTAAAMLSEGPHRSEEVQLLVDVGTNAEIVYGNRDHVLAASSPTGPAFEGAQISSGQRATVGAIERVRIDRDTLEPRFKVIGADEWSDDPGFAESTRGLDISGICGSGIIEVVGELYLSGIIDVDGTVRSDAAERSDRVFADGRTYSYRLHGEAGDDDVIAITQDDVRAIQLAKAALRAGIDLLREHAGDDAEIDSVRLAGAFGAHIDPLYAKVLGLVPDVPVDRVRSVGNAAGAGAVRALLSAAQRAEIETAVRRVEKIETATEPRFQELFVDAMGFPHTTAPTPNLATETTLPRARPKPTDARAARRRRRVPGERGRSV